MKFTRNNLSKILTIFTILFTLLSNNFIAARRTNTQTRAMTRMGNGESYTSRSFTSKGITFNEILNKLDSMFKATKSNIMYFIIGILSEFIPAIDDIFDSFIKLDEATNVTKNFMPCFNKFLPANQTPGLSSSPFSDAEKKAGSSTRNHKFCINFKKEIAERYTDAEKEEYADSVGGFLNAITPDFILDISYDIGGAVATKKKFCTCPRKSKAPKVQKALRRKYGSLSEYEKECLYFHSKDCEDFNPQTAGIKDFASTAYSYVTGIVDVGKCIYDLFDKGHDPNIIKAKMIIGKFFTVGNFLESAMSGLVGVVANILTAGLWGGLKGGYYIIKLIGKIKDFREASKVSKDAYKLGKIIGNCIMIVKSFLLGRRRRLMKRRFK